MRTKHVPVLPMDKRPKMNRSSKKWIVYLAGICLVTLLLYHMNAPCPDSAAVMVGKRGYVIGSDRKSYPYDREMPLIFIGGMPRSGTTLSRVMLDAHPDIRCGEETRVVPRLLQMRTHWLKNEKESVRLQEAGLTNDVLDSAIAAFILEVIAKHGPAAARLCNKDPFTLKSAVYLSSLFPNAKFIFMVRDGRAVVHSIITRKVTITGFDLTNYRQCLTKWNTAVQTMRNQCLELGPRRCLPVFYEQLVLHPKQTMEKILGFLDIPWNDSVMHHEQLINQPGGISLSMVERSTDQVVKPVNTEALTKWVGEMPDDVVRDMEKIAPMLAVLGYDPNANPPEYGKPDTVVEDNNRDIRQNEVFWKSRAQEMLQSSKRNKTQVERARVSIVRAVSKKPEPGDSDDPAAEDGTQN